MVWELPYGSLGVGPVEYNPANRNISHRINWTSCSEVLLILVDLEREAARLGEPVIELLYESSGRLPQRLKPEIGYFLAIRKGPIWLCDSRSSSTVLTGLPRLQTNQFP